ncbi:hypothetical protein DZF79_28415 [Vibrio parahaemolyticus]|nr:hypothetical protein [Vibrio parahaemolyticus]
MTGIVAKIKGIATIETQDLFEVVVVSDNTLTLSADNGNSPFKSLGADHCDFKLESGKQYEFTISELTGDKTNKSNLDGLVGEFSSKALTTTINGEKHIAFWSDGVMVSCKQDKSSPLKETTHYQASVVKLD